MDASQRIEAISAVVCNFNGAEYLKECLDSILAQDGIDQVIVVDNASEDGSVDLVRKSFPTVELIEREVNDGPCGARNEGMRRARHRWVLAVDNDAVLRPDVVPKLRQALEGHPERAVAQPRSVVYDRPDQVHYDGGGFHYVGLLSLRNFYRPLAEAEGHGVVPADALIGICLLLDRERVLGVGGYDEHFFYLAEDFDLALRLRQSGMQLVSVEDAIVLHKGGTQGLSFRGGGYPRRRAYLHSRNRWHLMAKCYAWRTLFVAFPGILVYELVWSLFALLQGHLGAHLAGKWAFFKELPQTLRGRREVQAKRRVRDRELLVGGPLTFSPSLLGSAPARLCAGALDSLLRAWWWLARPLAG